MTKGLVKRSGYGAPTTWRSSHVDLFDKIFGNFFEDIWSDGCKLYDLVPSSKSVEFPKVNVIEEADAYKVEIAVAGFDKDDVKLLLKDNALEISAEKKEESSNEESNYLRREISKRAFKRVIGFPKEVDASSCVADFQNGIIKVSFNKLQKEESTDGMLIEIN